MSMRRDTVPYSSPITRRSRRRMRVMPIRTTRGITRPTLN